jgi:hypothetical protein
MLKQSMPERRHLHEPVQRSMHMCVLCGIHRPVLSGTSCDSAAHEPMPAESMLKRRHLCQSIQRPMHLVSKIKFEFILIKF